MLLITIGMAYITIKKGHTLLKGPEGEVGNIGDVGDVGKQGPQGYDGEVGDQGSPGEKGKKGVIGEKGPSVKGPRGDPSSSSSNKPFKIINQKISDQSCSTLCKNINSSCLTSYQVIKPYEEYIYYKCNENLKDNSKPYYCMCGPPPN